MNTISRFFLLGLFMIAAADAEARKFDFKSERIAPFFGGTYSPSALGAGGYNQSSGTGTTFDKAPNYNYSGAFGVAWGYSRFGFVVSGEILSPQRFTEDIAGSDAAGTQLFTLNATTVIYVLSGTIEYRMIANPTSNLILGVGGGVGFANIDNDYTMTASGISALGVGSFNETAQQRVTTIHSYLGFEFLLADTVTMVVQAGYRYLPVTTLLSTKATTSITGAQTEGTAIKNNAGNDRSMNFTGTFAGIAFRFFL